MVIRFESVGLPLSIARASALLLITCVVGTIGYKVIGGDEYSWIEALYMTAVTLTTVGYREVIDLQASPGGQVFTMGLLIVGVGSFLYFFSNLTAFMVEGTLDRLFWRKRMNRRIARTHGHLIVCGGGQTGESVIQELLETKRDFVLIERDPERVEELVERFSTEFRVVVGDATDDKVLKDAGLERARGLVSCISSDKDNLVVTFSARNMRPEIRIVTRCTNQQHMPKLRKAGADAIVTPDRIGGLRLVSELVRPTAVTFLDTMLRDGQNWRIEEVTISPNSQIADSTVGELREDEDLNLMVVAVRSSTGMWQYNPGDATSLPPGTGLVFMGSPEAREQIDRAASIEHDG